MNNQLSKRKLTIIFKLAIPSFNKLFIIFTYSYS